jgi:2-iminobutanoate/2-iminopropanoate deaminase
MDIEALTPKDWRRKDLPLSPGIKYNDLIFVSGQVPRDAQGNVVGKGDIRKQTEQTLKNVEAVLRAAGATMDDVLKVNVYMKDGSQFSEMNEVYRKFFKERLPARATIQVALIAQEEILIEIEAVARVPK